MGPAAHHHDHVVVVVLHDFPHTEDVMDKTSLLFCCFSS